MNTLLKSSVVLSVLTVATTFVGSFSIAAKPEANRSSEEAKEIPHLVREATRLRDQDHRIANELSWHVMTNAEQRVLTALSSNVSWNLVEVGMQDLLDSLEDEHKIDIAIDRVHLNQQSLDIIDTNHPLVLRVSNVKLASALEQLLEPLALCYLVEDGVLKIVSENHKQASNKPVVRVYDVSRLLKDKKDANDLAEALQQVIAASDSSGTASRVTAFRQMLIARTTYSRHDEIVAILGLLESGTEDSSTPKPEPPRDER